MSLLQFMEMNILECIFGCVIAFVICMSFSSIGHFFLKGKYLALKSLIGMSFASVFIMICMSYCAVLSKYLIYTFVTFSFLASLFFIKKYWDQKTEILKSFLPVLLIFLYFLIRFFMLITQETGYVNFNCHETYFAAPALEIFKADYYSRLRLIDVYPYEWSRYHFFNGSFASLPLAAFVKKNYVTFIFAKFLTISFLLGTIFDCIRKSCGSKKAVIYFSFGCIASFVLSYNMVTWSSFTNNYSSLLLMGIVWLVMLQEDWETACMISLVLAVSTSRATLTGGFFFLFSLYMLFRNTNKTLIKFVLAEYKIAIFCIVVGIGCIVMTISGERPYGQSVLSLNFMDNMFHYAWMEIMSFGVFFENLTLFEKKDAISQVHFEFLILPVYAYMLIRGFDKLKKLVMKNLKLIFIFTLFAAELCFVHIYKLYGFNLKRYVFILAAFGCLYVLPVLAVYCSSPQKMTVPLVLFILSSLMQYMVFNAASSCVNYTMIISLIIICFSKLFVDDVFYGKLLHNLYVARSRHFLYLFMFCMGVGYFLSYSFEYSFFCSPKDYYSINLQLRDTPYLEEAFVYNTEHDADEAKLNALKGNRIHYQVPPDNSDPYMVKNSMCMRFLPQGYEKETVGAEK